ncbi:MAG: DUF2062 domain-containing protein [Pseudomonadales bacterium]|nr:DUF2062 domain-containing protein [Pseudomonadales bacterium]
MLQRLSPEYFSRSRLLHKLAGVTGLHRRLHAPELWCWQRHAVARAVLVGLFVAMLPLPMQMLLAAVGAVAWRCNLPLAVALVWLSNPLTIIPIAWFCTMVGCILLNIDAAPLYNMQFSGFAAALEFFWKPLFLGCIFSGIVTGLAGYYLTLIVWRGRVAYRWQQRWQRRLQQSRRAASMAQN